MIASTVRKIIEPGRIVSSGALVISWKPLPIIVPHDVSGACTPTPRKESIASSSMMLAKFRVKRTMIVEVRLGSSSPNITRIGLAPCEIAASTNSFWRRERTAPRSGRAMYGV